MKKICTIGVGYVGLVTGACLADLGNDVVCVNRNQEKSDNLKKGITLEVKQAYLSLGATREALLTAQENVDQAEMAFGIIETRYKNGLATNLEFMDAQLASMQARTNYLSALKDYYTYRAELFKAIGKED